jgi:hypothetical protein
MAIIYCQYPFQTEMKISFFGLRNQVDIAKNQIKMLINKHRMRTIRIGLDSKQVKNVYISSIGGAQVEDNGAVNLFQYVAVIRYLRNV